MNNTLKGETRFPREKLYLNFGGWMDYGNRWNIVVRILVDVSVVVLEESNDRNLRVGGK
jgi:hypothetical protein